MVCRNACAIRMHKLRKQVRKKIAGDFHRRRPPTVPLPQDQEEVRTWRNTLASSNLSEADRHCRLVKACFFTDAPTQVDRLKLGAMAGAQRAKPWKRELVQGVTLGAQIVKCAADEDPKN